MKPTRRGGFRDVIAAIMAGGFGTRFWPLSTPDRPKQFLTLLAGRSLYAEAFRRARLLVPPGRIVVCANQAHRALVAAQSPRMAAANVVYEPMRRDTAAALILAALFVERRWPGHVLVSMPSDHLVTGDRGFQATMEAAVAQARRGSLVTVGIPPTHPATGFGYLELAAPPAALKPQPVRRFVEKPRLATARRYLASGRFLWNSGIFIWQARRLLEEAARRLPATYNALAPLAGHIGRKTFARKARQAFRRAKPVSVDYGIMEGARDVWVVPAAFQWSDVGGWGAAETLLAADKNGNRAVGPVEFEEASRMLVITAGDRPVIVAGLRDAIVVQGAAGTLVCHKSAADGIKPLVNRVHGADAEESRRWPPSRS
jgi:mannose-1-phosphate guanylyltransferase